MDENYYKSHRVTKRTDIDIAKDKSVESIYKKISDNLGLKEYGELTYINTIYSLAKTVKEGSFDKDDFMYMLDQAAKTVSPENKEVIRKMLEETPYDKSKFFKTKYNVGEKYILENMKFDGYDYSAYNGVYEILNIYISDENEVTYDMYLLRTGGCIKMKIPEKLLDLYGTKYEEML